MPDQKEVIWVVKIQRRAAGLYQEGRIDFIAAGQAVSQGVQHPIDSAKQSAEYIVQEFQAAGQQALTVKREIFAVYTAVHDWYKNSGAEHYVSVATDGKSAWDSVGETRSDYDVVIKAIDVIEPEVAELALGGPVTEGLVALAVVGVLVYLVTSLINAIMLVIKFIEELFEGNAAEIGRAQGYIGKAKKLQELAGPGKVIKEAREAKEAEEKLKKLEQFERDWDKFRKTFHSFAGKIAPYRKELEPLAKLGAKLQGLLHRRK